MKLRGVSAMLMVVCLVFACTKLLNKKNFDLNNDIKTFVNIKVEHSLGTGKPVLVAQNISEDTLFVDIPDCLGVNIWPFLRNGKGEDVMINFKVRAKCEGKRVKLVPNETYKEQFKYKIEECFEIDKNEQYNLHFEYTGNIYNLRGECVIHDQKIKSNAIKIDSLK